MIRIGIDTRPALHQRTGVGNYVFNLIRSLIDLGEKEEFLLFSNSLKNDFDIKELKGLEKCVIRHRRFPNAIFSPLWNRFGGGIADMLLNEANVIHFTGQIPKKSGKLPSVATVHDIFNVKHPESVAPEFRVDPRFMSRALKSMDALIAVSEYTKRDVCDFLDIPENKVKVIHFGVEPKPNINQDTKALTETNKKHFGISGEYILCVGTIETRKNYLKMVEAFAIIQKSFPSIKLVIIGGNGWASDQVHEKIKRLQIENSVYCIGYVHPSELGSIYKNASAFVFPSIYEGFGLPVLEAFSFKTPIAISNITSLPEVAGDAALGFNPEDPEDIARKTVRLLEDSDLRKNLIHQGEKRISEFTWEKSAIKTLQVYRDLGKSP